MLRISHPLLLLLLLLHACGSDRRRQPTYQIHTLPSGEQVKVLGIGRINFAGSGPALMLRYQTDLEVDDTTALRAEADKLWEEFRKDAERAQVKSAVISANSAPSGGLVSRGRMFNFVYEKDAQGSWHAVRKE
jgi:hypothetical protein